VGALGHAHGVTTSEHRTILEEVLLNMMFETPSRDDVPHAQ
jgi:ATP-dependent protease Clp ATPase subunit